MNRQFIVTGVGYTGRRVCSQLLNNPLVCINRSAVSDLPDGADFLHLDLDRLSSAAIRFQLPSTILYTVPPPEIDKPDPRLAGFLGRLTSTVHRVVYLSTTGVYGDRQGDRVTEEDTPMPGTARARRRLQAEELLRRWCDEHRTELVILRVPGIYGPGRLGLDRIIESAPVIVEAESSPGNRIHVDDLAGCCVTAMTTTIPSGIYNVGDGDHRSGTAFSQSVAAILNLPPLPEVSLATAKRTFSDLRLSFLRESRIIDTTKMREVLGFTPNYTDPIRGIEASLAEK